ncbi:DUF3473 domain-containing protein [bacterium]|nr:MAG: DUF3473 domain-containing protein [bacterium]
MIPAASADTSAVTRRVVVLSMDIEDWYHVDYLDKNLCDRSYSMLDGLEVYLGIMDRHGVSSSFFCTGEIAESIAPSLRQMLLAGHEIGSHTQSHVRPLTIPGEDFRRELFSSKKTLEEIMGSKVEGFRAPCFSLDDEKLAMVREAGYLYDSSRIAFKENPRYGRMELAGFEEVRPCVFRDGDFFEFQMSTLKVLGKNVPVSGGGYLRIFPWWLMGRLIRRYIGNNSLYLLYIHPYELSRKPAPAPPPGLGALNNRRFRTGLGGVEAKLNLLIGALKDEGFAFTTFSALRKSLTDTGGA